MTEKSFRHFADPLYNFLRSVLPWPHVRGPKAAGSGRFSGVIETNTSRTMQAQSNFSGVIETNTSRMMQAQSNFSGVM